MAEHTPGYDAALAAAEHHGYINNLATQLGDRHASLLATAEDDIALLRARIAIVTRFIQNPAHDRAAREALARDLAFPAPEKPHG